jgi:hypothetical protein
VILAAAAVAAAGCRFEALVPLEVSCANTGVSLLLWWLLQ